MKNLTGLLGGRDTTWEESRRYYQVSSDELPANPNPSPEAYHVGCCCVQLPVARAVCVAVYSHVLEDVMPEKFMEQARLYGDLRADLS